MLRRLFGLLFPALVLPLTAAAQYPDKAGHLVVPFPAGGPTDVLSRVLAQKLSERWKGAVVVDNKPGAGGAIGSEFVAKSAPDGYTLVMATSSTHSIGPALQKLPYDPLKDFTPTFAPAGAEPAGSTPEAFAALIQSEREKWARLIRSASIKVE